MILKRSSKLEVSGIVLMLQAAVSFSIMALCVRYASKELPSTVIVFFRSFLVLLVISWLIKKNNKSFFGQNKKILCLRGITGSIALILHFYALANLPLGTAMLLNYTAPIFVVLLSTTFLREKINFLIVSMVLVAFLGIYLLVVPQGIDNLDWNLASLAALVSSFFAALAYVLIRSLKTKESPLTIIFYFMGVSTIASAFFLPGNFTWPSWDCWLAILGVALGALGGQLFLTTSLRRARASLVSPFSYFAPLLCFFYGYLFFAETISLISFAGAVLIIASGSCLSIFGPKKKSS